MQKVTTPFYHMIERLLGSKNHHLYINLYTEGDLIVLKRKDN